MRLCDGTFSGVRMLTRCSISQRSPGAVPVAHTNAFCVVLDSASVRRAVAEGVSETVIAAVLLFHERSVEEIASKFRPDDLGHVIRLVERSPSCYPPGTLRFQRPKTKALLIINGVVCGCCGATASKGHTNRRRRLVVSES
jgi:hypothetical protein